MSGGGVQKGSIPPPPLRLRWLSTPSTKTVPAPTSITAVKPADFLCPLHSQYTESTSQPSAMTGKSGHLPQEHPPSCGLQHERGRGEGRGRGGVPPQGFFRIIKNQGGGTPPPSPPPQTKVTIVGKNEIYNRENLVRPFLVHQVLGSKPPPPLPPPAQKKPWYPPSTSSQGCGCQPSNTSLGQKQVQNAWFHNGFATTWDTETSVFPHADRHHPVSSENPPKRSLWGCCCVTSGVEPQSPRDS